MVAPQLYCYLGIRTMDKAGAASSYVRSPETWWHRVKVLHVLNELLPSGAETMLRLSAEPWQRRGLNLEVLAVGDRPGTYAKQLADVGFVVHHHPIRPVTSFLPGYLRLLLTGRYDVVHVHVERANYFLAAVARSVGFPGVVRTVHNVFDFHGPLGSERQRQRRMLRRLGVVHVACGDSVAANELERFDNPTVLIRNTFDEARFYPATPAERADARRSLGAEPEDFLALVIGNCSSVKNHVTLLRALALPAAPRARLLHVGLENEESTGERLLADQLGLSDRVDFLGFIDNVPALLRAADCYVMPSLYEGLAVTALEMLGGGVPSIMTDVPGLRDLRPFVPDAWWVQPEPGAIAQALGEVASLPSEERERWIERTARVMRAHFGVEQHVTAYLDAYRHACMTRRDQRRARNSLYPE
jgi:glycosyltransferase involved in cell wall biosynthesis